MSQSTERTEELIQQYPYLRGIVYDSRKAPNVGFVNSGRLLPDEIAIDVQRADATLLFETSNLVGAYGNSAIIRIPLGTEEAQIGKRAQHLYVVTSDGKAREVQGWYISASAFARDSKNKADTIYDILSNSEHLLYPEKLNVMTALVVMTVEEWYEELPATNIRDTFGRCLKREVAVTICNAPKEGFANLVNAASIEKDAVISTKRLIKGILDRDPVWLAINRRLEEIANRFNHEVMQEGLREVVENASYRGMRADFGNVTLMTYIIAGRIVMTIQREQAEITLIAAEGEPYGSIPVSVQSLRATLPQAEKLVGTVIDAWKNSDNPRNILKQDDNVGML